nr:unnamed protein product [Callosobruchus chinensis]
MSHVTYDFEFRKVHDLLAETLQLEPVQADRRDDREILATLYVRYILIANRLTRVVDQMVQPQKRMLVKKLLEASLGRILELKTDLVEADLNEWTHCGDVMEKLNLTPLDVELEVPTCFRQERNREIEYRKQTIDSVLSKLGFLEKKEPKVVMTEQQAILIIQQHERARQGRLRAQFMKEIKMMKQKGKPIQGEETEEEGKFGGISMAAAMKIQKIWRGFIARRATRRRKLEEMLLIGMIPPPKSKSKEVEKDKENKERRRKLQEQRQIEYCEEVKRCKEYLEKNQREVVLEQLSDQVRNWLNEYKAQTGKIPEYTGEDRSPSRLLLSRQGSGKDMLVHAICTETGSVLFDLTPANIVGKYPGKSGLIMLMHLVTKVARLLQPSVIYMDNAERPFVKKIPKTDKTDPKRLKKDLPKMVKSNKIYKICSSR